MAVQVLQTTGVSIFLLRMVEDRALKNKNKQKKVIKLALVFFVTDFQGKKIRIMLENLAWQEERSDSKYLLKILNYLYYATVILKLLGAISI